jgi:hypothetical protein
VFASLATLADNLAYKKETENDAMVGSVPGFLSLHNFSKLYSLK